MLPRPRILRSFSRLASEAAKRDEKKKQPVIRRRGEFLYGVAPCTAVLQAKRRKVYAIYQKNGYLDKKTLLKRAALGDGRIRQRAEEMKVDLSLVERSTLDRLCGNRPHQGIVLDVAPLNFRRMDATDCKLSANEREKKPTWVLLDEIQDPMNFGAILRCCYYLGVERVIASMKRCCPLSPAVSKASAGAMELMPVYSVSHLEGFLVEAKRCGWSILGTAGTDIADESDDFDSDENTQRNAKTRKALPQIDCNQYTKQGPTLLVLGNEGHGMHREVEQQCEAIVSVTPHRSLPPGFDSLNVAVATGILLHALQTKT